jgi:DNA-binding MarR family transcriptional regulator
MCEDCDVAANRLSPDPEVAEFAGQLFFRLWRATHARVTEEFETIGLTTASFAVLNFVAAHNGAIQQEIGTAMGIDPSTMVSLIDGLEGAALAQRRTHASDRRARAVTITSKGRRRLARARQTALDVEGQILGGLSARERAELKTLMRRALDAAPVPAPWTEAEGD